MISAIKRKLFGTANIINKLPEIPRAKTATPLGFGFNFCREGTDSRMIETFFQSDVSLCGVGSPIETINIFPANWKLEHIAVSCGFFKSLSEARKSGWQGEIPQGYTEKTHKKRLQKVYIYREETP